MNGDHVVDLSDPVWNEISLRLHSKLTPKDIYDTIVLDKGLCKTKMIQALKTERSVFSGENPEISENMTEITPIVECDAINESNDEFNETLNEFKYSILQSNGQIVLKDDPVWNKISRRLKSMKSDEIYSRIVNNHENCRTRLFGVNLIHENKFFETLFAHRKLIITSNNSIANIKNEVWRKISEKLNGTLTPKDVHMRVIKDIDNCRTKLFESLSKKDLTRPQYIINKDKFLDLIISYKDSILKNGSHAKPSDPIWMELASKLNFVVKPLTLYNNFMLNRHNCQQKLVEACEVNKNDWPISSKITSQMDHDYTKGDVDTSFEDLVSMRQKVGYVQENDFIDACLVFKDRLVTNNSIVPSTDKVWNDISKHLNYAIKSKTAYLRFKRNTHNCQEKLFGNYKLNENVYEESYATEDQSIENEMFFDAISIFKHSIINNGIFATESSPVWLDVSNLMNNLLAPDEAFWKFRQNVDLCRTKLIKQCIEDWSNEPSLVIKNRIQLIKSKESLWKKSSKSKRNSKNDVKSLNTNDNTFYDAIYKHKRDIFHNDLVANCTSPVWTTVAKELNNEMEPSTIYSRFKNNMTKCNLKFAEAAQRHNIYKLKQTRVGKRTLLSTDDNSNDSCDRNNLIIDNGDDGEIETRMEKFSNKNSTHDHETTSV